MSFEKLWETYDSADKGGRDSSSTEGKSQKDGTPVDKASAKVFQVLEEDDIEPGKPEKVTVAPEPKKPEKVTIAPKAKKTEAKSVVPISKEREKATISDRKDIMGSFGTEEEVSPKKGKKRPAREDGRERKVSIDLSALRYWPWIDIIFIIATLVMVVYVLMNFEMITDSLFNCFLLPLLSSLAGILVIVGLVIFGVLILRRGMFRRGMYRRF